MLLRFFGGASRALDCGTMSKAASAARPEAAGSGAVPGEISRAFAKAKKKTASAV